MKKECLFHNTLLCSPDQNREANILSLYYNFIHLTCSDEITSNEAAKIIPCSVNHTSVWSCQGAFVSPKSCESIS